VKRRITFLTVPLLVAVALGIIGAHSFAQQRPVPDGTAQGMAVKATATTHSVVLAWTASSDGAANPTLAYNVYRGTAPGGESSTALNPSPVAAGCSSASTCTYTDTAVTVGNTYYYTVKATLNGGLSAASNEASATIPIAAPTGLAATGN
jgi:hypothetical protein